MVSKEEDWISDLSLVQPNARESTGYARQKPLRLLLGILAASSNPVDPMVDPLVVLDLRWWLLQMEHGITQA